MMALRFPIQPTAKTHYGGPPIRLLEDFVDARASNLPDSFFGGFACGFA